MSCRIWGLLLLTSFWGLFPLSALAQLIPDGTLGAESSTVVPMSVLEDRIEGGATRGSNLFHSFQEFNVGEGRGVYFANPTVIQHILTRVTGGNPSDILGRLGVLGEANLWLINPNGIYFGPDASLDIRGSFVGTTADGVWLGDMGYFSAVDVGGSQLLSIEPGALFSHALAAHQREINNRGHLQVGGDLTLDAGRLDLEGVLQAGGNLTLRSLDEVKIRDSVGSPFIAVAGGELLVQGNETVDILALNHPESGLFSGGDMVLRSGNAVGGDAHYFSGGSFRIEALDGELGDLKSPHDPVIRTLGDVFINGYQGASLHIIAGGQVVMNFVQIIMGADTANGLTETVQLSNGQLLNIDGKSRPTLDIRSGIDPAFISTPFLTGSGTFFPPFNFPTNPSSADIVLGNVEVKSGGQVFLSNQYFPNTSLGTVSGGISVGSIDTQDIFAGGSVTIDARNEININGGINVSANAFFGNGGDINLLSQSEINLNTGSILTSVGNAGGNIFLESGGTIRANNSQITSGSYGFLGGNPTGGDLTLSAQSLFFENSSSIRSATWGEANAGHIVLNATNTANFQNSGILSVVGQNAIGDAGKVTIHTEHLKLFDEETIVSSSILGQGNAGGIFINTGYLEVLSGAKVDASTFGEGNAGEISIAARDTVQFQGYGSTAFTLLAPTAIGKAGRVTIHTGHLEVRDEAIISASTLGQGDAGGIFINTGYLEVLNGAKIDASTFGEGNAGEVAITARDTVRLRGESNQGIGSMVSSQVRENAIGNAGGVTIGTGSLEVLDGAQISASTFWEGNAGKVAITARDSVRLQGENRWGSVSVATSQVAPTAKGNAGGVTINTSHLEVLDGAAIDASTYGQGNAGNVRITARDSVRFQGASRWGYVSGAAVGVGLIAKGNAGGVTIGTGSLEVLDGAIINASTLGQGNAGSVAITAHDSVRFQGASHWGYVSGATSQVAPTAKGNAGGVTINTGHLEVLDGAQIDANTWGRGNAGEVRITANDSVRFQGENRWGISSGAGSRVEPTGKGNAGGVTINTGRLEVLDGAQISASTFGQGNAGEVTITARDTVRFQGENRWGFVSGTGSQVEPTGKGNAGGVTINTGRLEVLDGAQISASTFGQGNAGEVSITARNTVRFQGASQWGIRSGAGSGVELTAKGNAGGVRINTDRLEVLDGAFIDASTSGQGNAGSVAITASDTVRFQGASRWGIRSSAGSGVGLTAKGNAGGVRINTDRLEVLDGAVIDASTYGQGDAGDILIIARRVEVANYAGIGVVSIGSSQAGNINIQGNELTLRNDSGIFAKTTNTDGGNININLQDVLLLRDQSQITTTAGTEEGGGNGGNITINASFIIGVPWENSDITANAFEGNGGNINITANAIYGLKFREALTPFSDITASSEFGLSGTLVFNPLNFPSEQGLNELPDSLVDAEDIIRRDVCALQDDRIAGGSSFTVTGRGGIPANPEDPLTHAPYVPEWATREGDPSQPTVILRENDPKDRESAPIRPVQGWYVAPDGTVHLTADGSTPTPTTPVLVYPNCRTLSE
ncbi:MAG: filamentous hemagglutinin N-terminal domain-containing protein [Spirulina sp.]